MDSAELRTPQQSRMEGNHQGSTQTNGLTSRLYGSGAKSNALSRASPHVEKKRGRGLGHSKSVPGLAASQRMKTNAPKRAWARNVCQKPSHLQVCIFSCLARAIKQSLPRTNSSRHNRKVKKDKSSNQGLVNKTLFDQPTTEEDRETKNMEANQGNEVQDEPSYQTFTESLQLDARYMDEFIAGNFLYLRPKANTSGSAYNLETVEHFETDPANYFTMSRVRQRA